MNEPQLAVVIDIRMVLCGSTLDAPGSRALIIHSIEEV